jgi:predicted lipid-binding transport protein (Tim44 family)
LSDNLMRSSANEKPYGHEALVICGIMTILIFKFKNRTKTVAPDLIIYGLVAAGLVFWLKSILGTRHGDERERPNPYAKTDDTKDKSQKPSLGASDVIPLAGFKSAVDPTIAILEFADNPKGIARIDNDDAKVGLVSIAKADKTFEIERFMSSCQDAFVYGVESFADGDRDTLRELLAPEVYSAFDAGISGREESGDIMECEIQGLREAIVTNAVLNGKMAFITVKFIADEVSVTRSATGEILEGHPDISHELRDLWVFGRNVNDRDPRWLVHETRDDLEGDNDTIPNAQSSEDTQTKRQASSDDGLLGGVSKRTGTSVKKKAAPKKAAAKKPAAKKSPAKKKPSSKK